MDLLPFHKSRGNLLNGCTFESFCVALPLSFILSWEEVFFLDSLPRVELAGFPASQFQSFGQNIRIHMQVRHAYLKRHLFMRRFLHSSLLTAQYETTLIPWQLTKVLALDRRNAADVSLDEKVEVWDDDEGRCQAGPGVVLNDQVVPLELPIRVTVLLDFREGVAAESKSKRRLKILLFLLFPEL